MTPEPISQVVRPGDDTFEAIAPEVVEDYAQDPTIVFVTKKGNVIRQVDEDDLDAEIVLKYQAMAAKAFKQNSRGDREISAVHYVTASHWLMLQLFTVDGQPLTIDHLTGKPSTNLKCLGLMAIAKMNTIATALIAEMPSGKE